MPGVRAPWDAPRIAALLRMLHALRPTIFQANAPSPWACEYGVVAALALPRARVVRVVHCPSPPTYERQRRLARLTSTRLAAEIAVGRASARELEAMAGLDTGSVTTIYNGVDDSGSRRTGSTGGRIVGWVGRLDDEKGIDVLLHALQRLPDVSAILVGDGPKKEQLEALARELGVAPRVEFAGWHDAPQDVLRRTDAFVLPSRIEAFPLSVLEAFLLELPVIASDVGSVSEVVKPGKTGLLVPPERPDELAAALRTVLDDGALARRLAQAGGALVRERFTARSMASRYEELYDRIAVL
jgi:glycosyltransferase involved in cell wall biosynthesis